jgi:RimJ/RimL family protein N-acetyltransferase
MPNLKNTPLETENLILRLPEPSDAHPLQRAIDDWDIAVTTGGIPFPYDLEMAEGWIQGVLDRPEDAEQVTYMMIRRVDKQLIGGCGMSLNLRHESADIGYWVAKANWGNGYATEAARRLIQLGFEELGLNRVQAAFYATNIASRRVMEKAGMTFEGIHRQAIIREIASRNHRVYHDLGYCAILRSEWDAKQ